MTFGRLTQKTECSQGTDTRSLTIREQPSVRLVRRLPVASSWNDLGAPSSNRAEGAMPQRVGDPSSRAVGEGRIGLAKALALPRTELLLQPVSESRPTGDNLEYQPEFAELERAARGKPARQMGSAIAPGEPPNYARVIDLASSLLSRSKDLRVAVQLARALLETAGFTGLAEGLRLVRALLERYWEALYPELDPDDRDATMRRAALSALSAPELISALRAAPLLESPRFGPISLRDIAIASGELLAAPSNPELDADVIAGSFRAADPGTLERLLDELQSSRAHLKAIDAVLASSPGMPAADFLVLERVLYRASAFVRPYVEESTAGAAPAGAGDADVTGVAHPAQIESTAEGAHTEPPASAARLVEAASERAAVSASIRGRADVVHWLDRICEYYAQHEPSSPLPLLLQRCRRLVASSFLEIVRDMAPDALSQIQLITGKTED
jgi:type VI secretion system protein ImpA